MRLHHWVWIIGAVYLAITLVWLGAKARKRWRETPSERAMRLLKKKYERKQKKNQRR